MVVAPGAGLSQGIAGPHCARLFAQHEADVIKIEPPAGNGHMTKPGQALADLRSLARGDPTALAQVTLTGREPVLPGHAFTD